jgi:hypothetical protein
LIAASRQSAVTTEADEHETGDPLRRAHGLALVILAEGVILGSHPEFLGQRRGRCLAMSGSVVALHT